MYAPLVGTLVVDEADATRAAEVEDLGVRCVVAPTVMHSVDDAARLAAVVLDTVAGLRAGEGPAR